MANINASTLRIGSNDLILQDAAARASMAPAYSASSTYAVGDIVLKDGQLYECNTAISTAEAWTAAHWTAVTVGDELSSLKEEISNIGSDFNLLTYDKSSNSYNHLGLDIHNFHIKGTITQGDKNICVTGDGVTDPTEISFSTLNEKYFSVPLVADKKYTFALLGNWESNGTPPNGVHVADKGTRTAKTITIPRESWGNGIATLSYTPTKTDVYAVKVYFPTAGTVDLQLALYPPNNVYQQISNITALTLSN